MIILCKGVWRANFEHLRETKDLAATSIAADKEFRRHAQLPELSAPLCAQFALLLFVVAYGQFARKVNA
jgi:hypothetical protein